MLLARRPDILEGRSDLQLGGCGVHHRSLLLAIVRADGCEEAVECSKFLHIAVSPVAQVGASTDGCERMDGECGAYTPSRGDQRSLVYRREFIFVYTRWLLCHLDQKSLILTSHKRLSREILCCSKTPRIVVYMSV